MEFKNFLQSTKTKHTLSLLGITIIALCIFQAGIFVGYKKASYSGRLGDNYYRAFGEHSGPREMMPKFGERGVEPTTAHGTIGTIKNISENEIIIADKEGVEKTMTISTSTDIRKFREVIKISDLKVGDFAVVIGEPNDAGKIEARLMRIMPSK